jgi:hypothetical protein
VSWASKRSALLAGLTLALAASAASAETAREILDRQQTLDAGPRRWADRYQRMQLTVTDRGGSGRHLEIETYDRKEPDQRQKSRVIFSAPTEKAGIELLGYPQRGQAGSQWLYAPEFRRVRQVAPSARANRFDITDFTYHDLDVITDLPNWTEQDAASTLRGTESVDGVACYVIELTPHLEHVAYPRIVLWLGTDDLVARQVEFYNEREQAGVLGRLLGGALGGGAAATEPVRRFRQRDIRTVGAIPVAYHIEIETPAEATKTTIEVVDVRFDQGLTESFFSPGSLGTHPH